MFLLSRAMYGSEGYMGHYMEQKFCLSYFVASCILHSICCLLTRCDATTYFVDNTSISSQI